MTIERLFFKPFDLAHYIMFNEYPVEYIKTIDVPGTFVEKISTRVHLKNGISGEMDSAFILNPDGEILKEKVAACLEHQTTPVQSYKLDKFGDFDIQLVSDKNLPTFLMVASHLNDTGSKRELIRSPSDITKLYFLNLGEENICKRLNTVSKIVENNRHLTTEDALNLGIILLYAPRKYACEITDKVVNLYIKITKDLDSKMEHCLYSVIYTMIDAYIDDEEEYRRLVNMINKSTSQDTQEAFAATKEYFINSLQWTKEDLEIAKGDLEIAKGDLEIAKGDLETANEKIRKQEKEKEELKKEIDRLKNELNGK